MFIKNLYLFINWFYLMFRSIRGLELKNLWENSPAIKFLFKSEKKIETEYEYFDIQRLNLTLFVLTLVDEFGNPVDDYYVGNKTKIILFGEDMKHNGVTIHNFPHPKNIALKETNQTIEIREITI
jgi:hypothetical protein